MGSFQALHVTSCLQQAQNDLDAALRARGVNMVGGVGWRAVARIHFVSPDGVVKLNTFEDVAAFVSNRLVTSDPTTLVTHGGGRGGEGEGGGVGVGAAGASSMGMGIKRKAGQLDDGGTSGLLSYSDLAALNSDVIAEKLAEKLAPVVRELSLIHI